MPLYMCDGCWDHIPALKARIHCKECEDFDLCANCFVVGRFGKSHLKTHETVLEERSGIEIRSGKTEEEEESDPNSRVPLMPFFAASTMEMLAKVPSFQISDQSSSQRKEKGPAQSPASVPVISLANSHSPPHNTAPFATSMPEVRQEITVAPYPGYQTEVPVGWQPLFDGTQPTQTLVDLLTAIFLCIDTAGTRLLAPEQYSSFLDIQGYLIDENIWKRNIKTQYGYNAEDIADFELRTAYENFSIDHVLQTRNSSMNTELPFQPGLSPISNGQMPMLSLRGFIDITAVETLGEPSVGWQRLNLAKMYHGVWMDWGDIPRSMIPDFPPQELLNRIARISDFAERKAAERMEARRAESARIAQQEWNSQMGIYSSGLGYMYR